MSTDTQMQKVNTDWINDPWFKRLFFTSPDANHYRYMYLVMILPPIGGWFLGAYLASIGFTL